MKQTEAYQRLVEKGIRPSLQRIAIMDWLIKHPTHPTIEDVYKGLAESIPTLSKTTVYNTLRMLSEHNAAQMITIDEHRVCYDGICVCLLMVIYISATERFWLLATRCTT